MEVGVEEKAGHANDSELPESQLKEHPPIELISRSSSRDILLVEEHPEDSEIFDETHPPFASRLDYCCSAFGFCIRAAFVLFIFLLALFLFISIIRAAWGVFVSYKLQGPKVLSPTARYSLRDHVAASFSHCANERRTMHSFLRNMCWDENPLSGEVVRFAILVNRALVEEDVTMGPKRLFLIDAMFESGSTLDGNQLSMQNMPALDTDKNVFRFDVERDFVTVRKESTWTEEVLQEGVLSRLPILRLDDDEVWLDATDFLQNIFFVHALSPFSLQHSVHLFRANVFPQNALLFLEISSRRSPLFEQPVNSPAEVRSLAFSFTLLSEHPVVAREAYDGLVGYFTSSILLQSTKERMRMIQRRRESDILFYIDPSVPVHLRQAVKRGVESWNKAMGQQHRVMAVLPDSDLWPQDYAVADVRYSTVSWSVSQTQTFAIGPSTVDPRSGQILNSDIVLANTWLYALEKETEFLSSPSRKNFCAKQNQKRSLLFTNVSTDYLEAGIADIVSHEVGHALGLRHNFKGSLAYSLSQLKDSEFVQNQGMAHSVMDYLPENPFFPNSPLAFPQRIGAYDVAAIRYGYEELEESSNRVVTKFGTEIELNSHARLTALALRVPPFGTDEDVDVDPENALFDLSSEPLDYFEFVIEQVAVKRARVFMDHELHRVDLAQRYLTNELVSAALRALRFVGGKVRVHSSPSPISEFVSLLRQERALTLVLKILTSKLEYFPVTNWFKVCNQVSTTCQGEGQVIEIHVREYVEPIKRELLTALLLDPERKLQRLAEGPLSLSRMLDSIVDAIFTPMVDTSLWSLQMEYVSLLYTALHTTARDQPIQAWLKMSLDRVYGICRDALKSNNASLVAHAHLCVDLIKSKLEKLFE